MDKKIAWPKTIRTIGFIFILIGGLDPMEGSLLILPGSGLIALGAYMDREKFHDLSFRLWMFILILIGVGTMFIVSPMGGIGGPEGLSVWFAILVIPYPIAWSLSFWASGETPYWALWGGIVGGAWYFVILLMMASRDMGEVNPAMIIVPATLSVLGAVTIAGCIWRIKHHPKAPVMVE
jgi:hypothetical protein